MCRHAGGMAEVAKENAIVICIWLVANDIILTYTRALVLEASWLMYHCLAINSVCTNRRRPHSYAERLLVSRL